MSDGGDPFPELTSISPGGIHPPGSTWLSFRTTTEDRCQQDILTLARRLKDRLSSGEVPVSTAELLEPIEFETERRTLFARRAYVVVVFLGLLGTVLGLQAALGDMGLMGDLKKSQELVGFINSSKGVLAHFGMAFFATAGGVIGTIVIGFAEYLFSKRQERSLSDFALFVDLDLRPFLRARYAPVSDTAASAAIVAVLESMATALPMAANELVELTHRAALAASCSSEAAGKNEASARVLNEGFHRIEDLPAVLSGHLASIQSASGQLAATFDEVSRGSESLLRQLSDTVMRQSKLVEDAMQLLQDVSSRAKAEVERAQLLTSSVGASRVTMENIEKEIIATKQAMPSVPELLKGVKELQSSRPQDGASEELVRVLRDLQVPLRSLEHQRTAPTVIQGSDQLLGNTDQMKHLSAVCEQLRAEVQGLRIVIQSSTTRMPSSDGAKHVMSPSAESELAQIHRVLFDIRDLLERAKRKRSWWKVIGRRDA